MGGSGSTVVDFGPFPGQSDVVVAITGQAGILAGSDVEAWVEPDTTVAGFSADGYPFDASRYLHRGANLTGAADSTVGIFSAFIYDDCGPTGSVQPFFIFAGDDGSGDSEFVVVRQFVNPTNSYVISGASLTGVTRFNLPPVGAAQQAQRRWFHLLASWDLVSNLGGIWIDDVLVAAANRISANPVAFGSVTDWGIGADATSVVALWRGAIADLYFDTAAFMDFTVAANRRKFTLLAGDGTPRPIDLGATGSGPTGAQPLCYFHMDHGADPATFLTNKGSGGNFTRAAGSAPIAGQALPLCIASGHSADEHALETIDAKADKSSIIAGTGFSIRVLNRQLLGEPSDRAYPPVGGRANRLSGKYNVGWAWN